MIKVSKFLKNALRISSYCLNDALGKERSFKNQQSRLKYEKFKFLHLFQADAPCESSLVFLFFLFTVVLRNQFIEIQIHLPWYQCLQPLKKKTAEMKCHSQWT